MSKRFGPTAAIVSMILFACSLRGSTLTLASSATTVQNDAGMPTINIAKNPVWADPLGTSSWVSFTGTGYPPDPSFVELPNLIVVSFTATFTLDGPVSSASLDVLADDTTDVILNGHMIMPQTATLGQYCTTQPIGCLTNTEGHLKTADFGSLWNVGQNTLQFDTKQLGSQSFGLDFEGTIVTTPRSVTVPEPLSAALAGSGLLGLLLFASARRRTGLR